MATEATIAAVTEAGVATYIPRNPSTYMGSWMIYIYKDTSVWIFVPNDYSLEDFVRLHRTELEKYIDEEGTLSQIEVDMNDLVGGWREIIIAGQTRYIFVPDGFPTVGFIQGYCPDIYYTLSRESNELRAE